MITHARRAARLLVGGALLGARAIEATIEPAPAATTQTPEEWWLAWAAEWEATAG